MTAAPLCPPVVAAHCLVCDKPFAPHWSYPKLRLDQVHPFTRTNRPRKYCSRACAQAARNAHGRAVRDYDRRWATVADMQAQEDAGQLAIPGAAGLPELPPRPTRK